MRKQGWQFIGPKMHPLRKWLVALAILALCAWALASGLSGGFPAWLQWTGWAFVILYWFGGSLFLILASKNGRRQNWGPAGLYPRPWRRWIADEPEDKSNRGIAGPY